MRFEPWEGCRYGQPNRLGLPERLLVLGESHYGDREKDRAAITKEVVKEVFAEVEDVPYRYRFFTSVFKVLCGPEREPTREALGEFCRAIAFYNFVQDMIKEPGVRPSKEQWAGGIAPFFECLDQLTPSHVVACGFGLWDNLPDQCYSRLSEEIEENIWSLFPDQGKRPRDGTSPDWVGRYRHKSGSCLILRIRHPSVAFSAPAWRPVLRRFFRLEVD